MADPVWCEAHARPQIEEGLAAARRGDPAPLQAVLHGLVEALQVDLADALMPEALPLLAEGAAALPPERWHHLLHDAVRWGADADALAQLLDMAERLPGLWEGLRATIPAARRRLEFGRALAGRGLDRVPLLSLGQDCMAFDLPQRFRFGIRHGGRPLFTPFSLAGHRPEVLLRVLEEGWEGYAPEGEVLLLRSTTGLPFIVRRDGHVIWNHHLGEHWAAEGFARFRASIAALQARFDTALDGVAAPAAVFVISSAYAFEPERDAAYLERVLRALDARPGWPRPHLVALHAPREPGPLAGAADGWRLGGRIAALELPIPRPDYVWWHDLQNATPEGLAFETRIATWLMETTAAWTASLKDRTA